MGRYRRRPLVTSLWSGDLIHDIAGRSYRAATARGRDPWSQPSLPAPLNHWPSLVSILRCGACHIKGYRSYNELPIRWISLHSTCIAIGAVMGR